MPRQRSAKKQLTLDEQIQQAQANLDSLRAQVTEAEEELEKLSNMKKEEEFSRLMDVLSSNGKTINDVIDMFTNTSQE